MSDNIKDLVKQIAAIEAPKLEYEMTPEQFQRFKDACNPVLKLVGLNTLAAKAMNPVERATVFWVSLGRELGFDPETMEPLPASRNKHLGWFMAHPALYDAEGNLTESIRTIDARAQHGITYNTVVEAENQNVSEKKNDEDTPDTGSAPTLH
jgi:hypothetical protein